jgi:hypothetical protein
MIITEQVLNDYIANKEIGSTEYVFSYLINGAKFYTPSLELAYKRCSDASDLQVVNEIKFD